MFSTFHVQLSSVLVRPIKSISSWSSVLDTAISDDFWHLATSQVRRKRWLAYLLAVGYETDAILLLYAWYPYGLRGIYIFSQYQTSCECWIPERQDPEVQILQRLNNIRFPLSLLPGFQHLLPKEPLNCQFYTLHLSSNLPLIQKTLSPLIIFQAPSPWLFQPPLSHRYTIYDPSIHDTPATTANLEITCGYMALKRKPTIHSFRSKP